MCAALAVRKTKTVDVGDESCFLNAVLCYAEMKDGLWQAVPDVGKWPENEGGIIKICPR